MKTLQTDKLPSRRRKRSLKDYDGERFGMLTAVELVARDPSKENNHIWWFVCDCGASTDLRIKSVRSGNTRSCGCLARSIVVERNSTHGLSRKHPREYRCWKDMRSRCNTQTRTDYHLYGGRGISVCDRWDDFGAFLSDMGSRPNATSIDRIDVNGNYEPGNCRWADATVQANNKRSNHILVIDGERKTLQEWCNVYGVEPSKVRYRLKTGMSPKKAFTSGDLRLVKHN